MSLGYDMCCGITNIKGGGENLYTATKDIIYYY